MRHCCGWDRWRGDDLCALIEEEMRRTDQSKTQIIVGAFKEVWRTRALVNVTRVARRSRSQMNSSRGRTAVERWEYLMVWAPAAG